MPDMSALQGKILISSRNPKHTLKSFKGSQKPIFKMYTLYNESEGNSETVLSLNLVFTDKFKTCWKRQKDTALLRYRNFIFICT